MTLDGSSTIAALDVSDVNIDEYCVGSRWSVQDIDQLARLVAIIALGQAKYAAHIVSELLPASPAFTSADLRSEAIIKLTVQEKKQIPRKGYPRWQRDGFIFEAISWIAARQKHGASAYLKDPHISSTSQGIDGLMIEMNKEKTDIDWITIFEDKCTDNPRDTFTQKVIPAFLERHKNKRCAELIATAASLIEMAGFDDVSAIRSAKSVLDINLRKYRAALALTGEMDSDESRRKLFEGYEQLMDITQEQRIGASFIVEGHLRDWFDALGLRAVAYLESLQEEDI